MLDFQSPMASTAPPGSPATFNIRMGSTLRFSDDELFELCGRNPELRIERSAEGDLIVMTPAGGASGHRNAGILRALGEWARRDGTGLGFDSSTGFLLANGAMRAPDAAWVQRSRLEPLSPEDKERFLPLTPDFVVELRSPSDRIADLEAKMAEYLSQGARLGWLIDPQERQVHVYCAGQAVEILDEPAEVAGDPELSGFVLELAPIWAPL